MLDRFGSSIHAEKARAGIYQLRQGKMSVLQYADAFESFLAQIDDYDEDQYLVHFIFGLRPEISRLVYIQQPASILAARNVAEKLELTHQATELHQRHMKEKKTSKAQQKGTQKRRSGNRDQLKTYVNAQRQKKKSTHSHRIGSVSAHTGAFEASCPDGHGPAVVWRPLLKDLPLGDRARQLRRQGSVMIASLEALTHGSRTSLPAGTTEDGMSMHPPSGRAKAP